MIPSIPAEALLGPKDFLGSPAARTRAYSRSEAEAYTRWLATHHYENFHVVSFLLPKHLHQDFFNVYAYCRWADDLGDEIGDKTESLRLLAWWRQELARMYRGEAEHPVFVALRHTVERRNIPAAPFHDLITAFEQDQIVSRYPTWDDVLGYCRYSANPVGRLILYLGGYSDDERQRLSDATCTGLQLANFWQDVTVDLQKDRVYVPLETLARQGYSVDELFALKFDGRFREAMRECVDRARALFVEGLPLAGMVDRRLSLDIDLFSRGGMKVLDKIEAQGFDVLKARPAVSKIQRVQLLFGALLRMAVRRAA